MQLIWGSGPTRSVIKISITLRAVSIARAIAAALTQLDHRDCTKYFYSFPGK